MTSAGAVVNDSNNTVVSRVFISVSERQVVLFLLMSMWLVVLELTRFIIITLLLLFVAVVLYLISYRSWLRFEMMPVIRAHSFLYKHSQQ